MHGFAFGLYASINFTILVFIAIIAFILGESALFHVFSWTRVARLLPYALCANINIILGFVYGCNTRETTLNRISELVNGGVFLADHPYKENLSFLSCYKFFLYRDTCIG